MSLEVDVERGRKADRLLQDPMLNEAFDLVHQAIHERWEACPLRDRDGAHELRLQLKTLNDVRANLEQAIQDGKLAAAELKTQNEPLSPAQWRAATR